MRLIGAGGMGAVYEGVHRDLRKRVAIKTLLPALAGSSEARTRFLREGEAAARLDHQHVVNVTDVGTEGDVPYLVMEYLEGETFGERLARQGALDVPTLLDMLLPIMDALAHGHDRGVIHRDLKPQNIFLVRGREGRFVPKLLDFGVSKLTNDAGVSALTGTLVILGTAQYMAPEQVDGAKYVEARTDQYAMGLVLYEGVTGQSARKGDSTLSVLRSIALNELCPPRDLRPDLDPRFEAVILKSLALRPADRFPTMRALAAALLPFAGERARHDWAASSGTTESASRAEPAPMRPAPGRGTAVHPAPTQSIVAPTPSTFRRSAGELLITREPLRKNRQVVGIAVASAFVLGVLGIGLWQKAGRPLAPAAPQARPAVAPRAAAVPAPAPAAAPTPSPVVTSPEPSPAAAPIQPKPAEKNQKKKGRTRRDRSAEATGRTPRRTVDEAGASEVTPPAKRGVNNSLILR